LELEFVKRAKRRGATTINPSTQQNYRRDFLEFFISDKRTNQFVVVVVVALRSIKLILD